MSNSRYYIKVKISPEKIIMNGTKHDKLIWIHSNDLISFVYFLDEKYPEWCWFNVYDNKDKTKQLANFTKNNRPTHRVIWWHDKYI